MKRKPSYLLLILLLAVGVNIYIHFPEIINKYCVYPDVGEHYFLYGLNDNSVFRGDMLSACRASVYATAGGYIFLVKVLSKFFPLLGLLKFFSIFLSIVSTLFIFKAGTRLRDEKFGFLVSVIFLVYSSTMDSFFGGLQRSFAFAVVCGFIYSLARGGTAVRLSFILISALFYPTLVPLVSLTCLVTIALDRGLSLNKKIACIILVILGNLAIFSVFSSVLSGNTAELGNPLSFKDYIYMRQHGLDKTYSFLITNENFFNRLFNFMEHSTAYTYFTYALLPFLFIFFFIAKSSGFSKFKTLLIFTASSVFMFLMIDFLFPFVGFAFRYPSRQTIFAIPLFLVFTSAWVISWAINRSRLPNACFGLACMGIFIYFFALFKYGCVDSSPKKAVFDYIGALPADSLIAGDPSYLSFAPIFTKRKVFIISGGIDEVFHDKYFKTMIARTKDLFKALYSESDEVIREFCRKYGITHFVINEECYREGFFSNDYTKYEKIIEFAPSFEASKDYLLPVFARKHHVFRSNNVYIVDASAFFKRVD